MTEAVLNVVAAVLLAIFFVVAAMQWKPRR